MSEEKYEWTPEYDEPAKDETSEDAFWGQSDDSGGISPEDEQFVEELKARRAQRMKQRRRQQRLKKSLLLIGMIVLFAVLFTMCGREIVRLKAENYELRKEQQELTAERDRLARELENVNDKEYIKDQARKQLRLLDPGEIMFVFEDEQEQEEAAEAEEQAESEKDKDKEKDKEGEGSSGN